MGRRTTYRNARAYEFCTGCSHRLVLEALDRALVRLQWDPAEVVIVSDIGCAGLSDQYFVTSGFHGLHGRSLTYATGIKLARPDLHIINLIGDGGCGIGCTHLVSAARRNIGVTTLVFNNLNFGMTGGEHSVTTPQMHKTATTPWGNPEMPLDIAQTAAVNGASYVWRGTAYQADLDRYIEAGLRHIGFALLDIWELCVAYYAPLNRVTPQQLRQSISAAGLQEGMLRQIERPEGSAALRETWAAAAHRPNRTLNSLEVRFSAALEHPVAVMIAGDAGDRVRTAGRILCTAATMSDLWASQSDDYSVAVRSGYSLSEILLAPTPIRYSVVSQPDLLFILSQQGYTKVAKQIEDMGPEGHIFVLSELVERLRSKLTTKARLYELDVRALQGVARSSRMLATVAAGAAHLRLLTADALLAAAAKVSAAYAETNQRAVRAALDATNELIIPLA